MRWAFISIHIFNLKITYVVTVELNNNYIVIDK